jgi:hypothetical protein
MVKFHDQQNNTTYRQEFGDARMARETFGISRSLLYELEASGLIRSVSLRRRGRLRGKRLWDFDSIRAYLTTRQKPDGACSSLMAMEGGENL